jgi:DnaJ-class molecular chaperone
MGQVQQDWTVGQMSEHDDEPREDFGASRDEETPEGDDADTVEEEEQTSAQAATDDGSDALIKKAEKAQTNYAKQIRRIFGDNAPQYDCPACNGLGLVWNLDEPTPELVHPDNLVTCDSCNGYGSVITGSKAPGRETTVCIVCSGNGYRTVTPQPENVTPIVPNAPTPSGALASPVMGWMSADGVFQPLGAQQSG